MTADFSTRLVSVVEQLLLSWLNNTSYEPAILEHNLDLMTAPGGTVGDSGGK